MITDDGFFLNGKLNGKGKQTGKYNEGDILSVTAKGYFVDGKQEKRGKYIIEFLNGDYFSFVGEFRNDQRQQGTERGTYASGEYYIYAGDYYYKDNDDNVYYNNGTCTFYTVSGNITKQETYINGKVTKTYTY